MGGSSSPPQPIDPGQVAQTQQGYNTQSGIQSQAGSMVNQNNPYGSVTYQQTGTGPGGIPIYSSNVNLTPQQQQLFNSYFGSQAAAGQGGQGLLQGANYGSTDPTQAIGTQTSGIMGGLTNQWLQAQQPWMNNQTTQLDTQLRNQGLNPSPTATNDPATWGPYEKAMGQLRQSQTMAVAGAVTQFQPQAFQEATSLYSLPAQLGTALASFGMAQSPTGQMIQTPQLSIGPADYTGAVSQAENMQMQAYQAQLAQQSAMMQGLFGLGGNLMGAGILKYSNKILKSIIGYLGIQPNGLPLFTFKYHNSPEWYIGYMVEDVRALYPEAVVSRDGFDLIDYNILMRY